MAEWRPRRALVLGASGYLGRHLCAALAAAGTEVVAVARRRGTVLGAGRWFEFDLSDNAERRITELLNETRADVLVNAIGCTRGSDLELTTMNVDLVRQLISAVRAARRRARIVHIGSSAEYGPTTRGVRLREDAPLRPQTMYGTTKAKATHALLDAFTEGAAEGVVVRVFNPVGPGASPVSVLGRVAAELVHQSSDGSARVVVGPLGAYRDFVDVRDVAEAVRLAAFIDPAPQRVLNVARGEPVSVRQAVETLVNIARPGALLAEEGVGSPRSLEVDWQQADIRAAFELLGWAPQRTLKESMADLWRSVSVAPGDSDA